MFWAFSNSLEIQDVTYTSCTTLDRGQPWCATATNSSGNFLPGRYSHQQRQKRTKEIPDQLGLLPSHLPLHLHSWQQVVLWRLQQLHLQSGGKIRLLRAEILLPSSPALLLPLHPLSDGVGSLEEHPLRATILLPGEKSFSRDECQAAIFRAAPCFQVKKQFSGPHPVSK